MKTFNTADVCEEAHRLTVLKCKRLGLEVDAVDEDDEDEVAYTDEAQVIFDEFFEAVEQKWEADPEMKREV
jgi:ribose 5-phosphate isomerase